jgi:hypothetical protein
MRRFRRIAVQTTPSLVGPALCEEDASKAGVKLGRSIVTEIFPEPVNLSFELVVQRPSESTVRAKNDQVISGG